MHKAICKSCGHVDEYLPKKGEPLSKRRCRLCLKQDLHRARWMGNGWAVLKRDYRERGHPCKCVVCGSKRLTRSGRIRKVPFKFVAPQVSGFDKSYPAGSWCCFVHDVVEAPTPAATAQLHSKTLGELLRERKAALDAAKHAGIDQSAAAQAAGNFPS